MGAELGMQVRWVLPVVAMAACGGGPAATRGGAEVRAEVAAVEAKLPDPPPDALWADGFGPTAREAALDAKRAVAEQIESKVAGVVESEASESTGQGVRVDVRTRVRSESRFDHAELIEVLATEPRPGGFAARAWLDRDRTAGVYREEIAEDAERLRGVLPEVERAIASLEASVLLSRQSAPGFLLGEQRRKRGVIAAVGRAPPGQAEDEAAMAVERRASALRQRAVLRLAVEGEVPAEVRTAAIGEGVRLFAARGCRLSESAHDFQVADDAPTVNVTLRLRTRDHQEAGMRWRYLGLELETTDARSGRPLFRYAGPPEIAHAGGASWAQADQALARRLRDVLDPKLAGLEAVTCR